MNVIVEKLIIVKKTIRLRNMMYWLMIILCVFNSGVFIYKLLIDIQNVTAMWQLGVPFMMALYTGIIGIMCEYRPRNTELQRRHDDMVMDRGLQLLVLLTVVNIIVVIYKSAQPH